MHIDLNEWEYSATNCNFDRYISEISRIDDFEFTPECAIFDLLDIPLYHGWIVDPQVWICLLTAQNSVVLLLNSVMLYLLHCFKMSFVILLGHFTICQSNFVVYQITKLLMAYEIDGFCIGQNGHSWDRNY